MGIYNGKNTLEQVDEQISDAWVQMISTLSDVEIAMTISASLALSIRAILNAVNSKEDKTALDEFVIERLKEQLNVWKEMGNELYG